jgi:hypothetical protein
MTLFGPDHPGAEGSGHDEYEHDGNFLGHGDQSLHPGRR